MIKSLLPTLLPIALLLGSNPAATAVVVQQDGSGDAETIEEALTLAADNEVILVGPGTYNENSLVIAHSVEIRSTDGPEATTIDAEYTGRHFAIHDPVAVTFHGLRFARGSHPDAGGSISVRSGAQVEIRDCVFEDNEADSQGAALHVREVGSHLLVEDCVFVDNNGDFSASIYSVTVILGSSCTIRRSRFHATNDEPTAAVAVNSAHLEIEDCLIHDNTTNSTIPGHIDYVRSTGACRGNTLVDNSCFFGTISIRQSPSVEVSGNVIVGEARSYGLAYSPPASGNHGCNLFFRNLRGPVRGTSLDPTEIVADPLFCDPEAKDFTVAGDSPALETNNTCAMQIGQFGQGCAGAPPEGVRLAVTSGGGAATAIVQIGVEASILEPLTKAVFLGAIEFDLTWEASVGELLSVLPTDMSDEWSINSTIGPGTAQVSMTRPGGQPLPTEIELLALAFHMTGTSPASTSLKLSNIRVLDGTQSELANDTTPGTLSIVDCLVTDVDDSGDTNSADGVRTLQIAAELHEPSPRESCAADVTQDGFVTSGDAVLVLQTAVGLPKGSSASAEAELSIRYGDDRVWLDLEGAAGADLELTTGETEPIFGIVNVDTGTFVVNQIEGRIRISVASITEEERTITLVTATGTPPPAGQGIAINSYDSNGAALATTVHDPGPVASANPPASFDVSLRVHPNPFNPATTIRFSVHQASRVALTVHDARGRELDELLRGELLTAGSHEVRYEPQLPSGVYHLRMTWPGGSATERLVLLK